VAFQLGHVAVAALRGPTVAVAVDKILGLSAFMRSWNIEVDHVTLEPVTR
jgi:hypothetical protein